MTAEQQVARLRGRVGITVIPSSFPNPSVGVGVFLFPSPLVVPVPPGPCECTYVSVVA